MRGWVTLIPAFLLLAASLGPARAAEGDPYAEDRAIMVTIIAAHARSVGRAALDPRESPEVMAAMGRAMRHEFVPDRLRDIAYADRPLPIGHGQTISQPYIVALMTHLLRIEPGDVVLEVGTGSGYQAAILAELDVRVRTIEIIPELHEEATKRLVRLGYGNVETRAGDGYYGWPDAAPFDGIVVTAAAGHVPPPLVQQLNPGGRMVIPVGDRFSVQHLVLVQKETDGRVFTRQLLPVRFVPLTGQH